MAMIKTLQNNRSAKISLELTSEEVKLLASLAADQLFRREFIDSKIPGFRSNSEELALGKALLERLRALTSNGQTSGQQTSGRAQRRAV